MIIKYFDDFNGTWNDVSGSTGSTLVLNEDGEWTTSVGYKVYVGLVTQTGTSDPTDIELENTLGFTVNWKRSLAGSYYINVASGTFDPDKTFVTIPNKDDLGVYIKINADGKDIWLRTQADGDLNKYPIEIRVYN